MTCIYDYYYYYTIAISVVFAITIITTKLSAQYALLLSFQTFPIRTYELCERARARVHVACLPTIFEVKFKVALITINIGKCQRRLNSAR